MLGSIRNPPALPWWAEAAPHLDEGRVLTIAPPTGVVGLSVPPTYSGTGAPINGGFAGQGYTTRGTAGGITLSSEVARELSVITGDQTWAWHYTHTAAASNGQLIGIPRNPSGSTFSIFLRAASGGDWCVQYSYDAAGLSWDFRFGVVPQAGKTDVWVVTRRGNSCSLYRNGLIVGTASPSNNIYWQTTEQCNLLPSVNGALYELTAWKRALSASEAAEYSRLLAAGAGVSRILLVSDPASAGGTDLVVQDATHGHTADNLGLTQQHELAVQDAAHAHAADNLALTQQHELAVADALHGHAADNVVLSTDITLSIADALHDHSAENITLVQQNVLVVQDATHGHAADNVTLDTGVALAVADASHGHTVDNLVLTQQHVLAVADALHGHTADNVVLMLPLLHFRATASHRATTLAAAANAGVYRATAANRGAYSAAASNGLAL